jgi:RNA polymerase sigma-70 factor (ECF subfamily)
MVEDMTGFKDELVALLPRLRRFALATTNSRHDADDLLQAAIERALRHEHSWQQGTRLDSWMFKIIQNLWLDELRAHRRKAEPLETIVDLAGEDGRDSMTHRVQLEEVRNALHALPDDQRAVIALVVLDGMSYQETSVALGIPIGTVMSRLARGRAVLATRLGKTESRMKVAKS